MTTCKDVGLLQRPANCPWEQSCLCLCTETSKCQDPPASCTALEGASSVKTVAIDDGHFIGTPPRQGEPPDLVILGDKCGTWSKETFGPTELKMNIETINSNTLRCAQSTCNDGEKNGEETGVDCGGSCKSCKSTCVKNSDCQSGEQCTAGKCIIVAECNNGRRDLFETDIDCGDVCEKCVPGQMCRYSSDCQNNGACVKDEKSNNEKLICAEPACDDEIKNGEETGIDCGGDCEPCLEEDLKKCSSTKDCKRWEECKNGMCIVLPECSDSQQQGSETDVDCGGKTCAPCADGLKCTRYDDCLSGICVSEKSFKRIVIS
jgi:hypothetical protein